MKYFQRSVSFVFILGLLLTACQPQSAPEPTATVPLPSEATPPAIVNAVYYRQGSGIFAERTSGESLALAHYMWLTPNGTVMTVITPLDQENGVCGDIYSISTAWNDDPETVNAILESATGTYSIEGDDITLDWDGYGISYSGTYGQSKLSLDVNGRTEDFVLASSIPADQVRFPDECVYDQYADSGVPDPVIDPEPKLWNPFLDFYASVLLDNGMLLLSFESTDPIPAGNYWINIHAQNIPEEEDIPQAFECQVLGDYPNRLYCHGSPLKVGAEYQISFVRQRAVDYNVQEALATDYFELRSNQIDKSTPLLIPQFDFSRISGAARDLGMNEVKTVGQAWNVVGACVQTYLGGDKLPESCQWFVAYSLGLGANGFEDPFFFDDPIIAFEDPFFFDDPIIAFENPLAGFENPIIAFEDPFFFDDPIIAFEDPFFFENPIFAFEDPFFFEDPIFAFEDPIFAFEDPFFFKNLSTAQAGWITGVTQASNRGLGFNCGQALNIPYSKSLGTYTDQVYVSALAQRQQGKNLPNACEALIVQCALTPGNGCFISPGALGWTFPKDGEPRTTGFDCEGESAGVFFCQEVKYPGTGLYADGQACGKEIKWGTPLRTYGHYADLMFYLASVSPWLTRESLPQTCVDFVTQGAHSLYGISPLAIWGSNGTHLSAFGLPLVMTMPEPHSGTVLKPAVPGNGNSSGVEPVPTLIWIPIPPPVCVVTTCGPGEYFDIPSCSCKTVN